jgi:hypothetical protein
MGDDMLGSGLGLLPLEKIPIFVWGLILVALGGFLFFQDEAFSWGQVRSSFVAMVGVFAVIYDVRKRSKEIPERESEEK